MKIIKNEEQNDISQEVMEQNESFNNYTSFNSLINQIELTDWKKNLIKYTRLYNLGIYKLDTVTPRSIKSLYSKVITKYNKLTQEKSRINWFQNELKIFVWLLCASTKAFNLPLESYKELEIQKLSQPFYKINVDLCEYQLKILTCSNYSECWNHKQNLLLTQLVKKYNFEGSWTTISKELFLESGRKYLRTAHACRQKWQNHLDVRIVKGLWTLEDDYIIIKNRVLHGKKWSMIAKLFGATRTQHMVKNRFKVILKRESMKKQVRNIEELDICRDIQRKLYVKINYYVNTVSQTSTNNENPNSFTEDQIHYCSIFQHSQKDKIQNQQKTHNTQQVQITIKIEPQVLPLHLIVTTPYDCSLEFLCQYSFKDFKEQQMMLTNTTFPLFIQQQPILSPIQDLMKQSGLDYLF